MIKKRDEITSMLITEVVFKTICYGLIIYYLIRTYRVLYDLNGIS